MKVIKKLVEEINQKFSYEIEATYILTAKAHAEISSEDDIYQDNVEELYRIALMKITKQIEQNLQLNKSSIEQAINSKITLEYSVEDDWIESDSNKSKEIYALRTIVETNSKVNSETLINVLSEYLDVDYEESADVEYTSGRTEDVPYLANGDPGYPGESITDETVVEISAIADSFSIKE